MCARVGHDNGSADSVFAELIPRKPPPTPSCWDIFGRCCGGAVSSSGPWPHPWLRSRRLSIGPETEEDFRSRIEFLATLPLFGRMPRAQFPMLARVLKARRWEPGKVVLQCVESQAQPQFYLIASGWAKMQMHEKDQSPVRLQRGDYFGDALLTERLPGKVIAGTDLVTLSMSASEFKKFDLRRYLRGARRRAVGRPGRGLRRRVSDVSGQLLAERRDAVAEAVRRNKILRSLVGLREEVVQQICDAAEREEVPAGTEVYRRGEYGGRFYIVESGSFELLEDGDVDGDCEASMSPRGVDCTKSETLQRMRRKEHFLQTLMHRKERPETEEPQRSARGRQHQHRHLMDDGPNLLRTHSEEALMDSAPPVRSGCGSVDDLGFVRINSDPAECVHREQNEGKHRASSLPEHEFNERCASLGWGLRRQGDSFGEMALLYHAPRPFTAVAREDSVVWCVDQDAFRRIMHSKEQVRVERLARDLDRVDIFQGLLSHEKLELAQNFLTLTFKEGDWIVRQGEFQNVWYILVAGECCMSRTVDQQEEELATLRPIHHFGERALLRETPSDFSVRVVSEEGARCLVLDGPTFNELAGLLTEDVDFRRAVEDDLLAFARYKGSRNPRLVGLLERLEQAHGHQPRSSLSQRKFELDPSLCERALDRVGLLGVGAFGAVSLERDPQTGKLFALKTLSKGLVRQHELEESVQNEREIMTMIDSPFTLRLHGTFKDENYVYFLFEPLLGGDLHFLIRCPETSVMLRRPRMHKFLLACVVCGLEHLHERNIVYRDLKSENVLLGANGYAKICDFGFAKFVLGRTMTLCGTPEYVAPEAIEPVGYDRMVDWWALGVLTFEVICGDTPFSEPEDDEPSPVVIFQRVLAGIDAVRFPFGDAETVRFIKALLQRLPGKRLGIGGAVQVKRCSFYSRFDFDSLGNQEMEAPYIPPLSSEEDMSMFDAECQEMPEFVDYIPDGSNWDADF
mmetsp:Transcript_57514/g.168422  ORF Transcript_57514/g.168422 Transcript_57514/m.168422 type:complete len:969 (-) Transcript_57514:69-2975(-)